MARIDFGFETGLREERVRGRGREKNEWRRVRGELGLEASRAGEERTKWEKGSCWA